MTPVQRLGGRTALDGGLVDNVPVDELPELEHHRLVRVDENTLEAEIRRDESINSLFSELTSNGIRVNSMRNKTNRLEELFMSLVENGQDRRAS